VNPSDKLTYLVVDDDVAFAAALARALRRHGNTALVAHNIADALSEASAWKPDRAIVDLRIERENGIELVARLKEHDSELEVVLLTGFGSIPTAVQATKAGAVQYLTKPATVFEILKAFDDDIPGDLEPATNTLDDVEWEHISRVLTDVGGNISEAARRLNMHRRTLQRKLARHRP
jgi:two-component system response regulator RegA